MVYIALAVSVLLIIVDQLIKYAVVTNMEVLQTIPVIQDVLHWTYVQNEGAAFGIFEGQQWFLIGLTSIVLLGMILLLVMKKIKTPFLIWSMALVIGGGVGNLIDRMFRVNAAGEHFVVDYIEVRLINFAVFNFADCCVVVGTILLIGYLLFGEWIQAKLVKKKTDAEQQEKSAELQAEKQPEAVVVDLDDDYAE